MLPFAPSKVWGTVKNPFSFRLTRVGNQTLVTQSSYVIVTVSCIMDFDLYPFDKQVLPANPFNFP